MLALPGTSVATIAAALTAATAVPMARPATTTGSPGKRTSNRAGNTTRVCPGRPGAEASLGRGHRDPNPQSGSNQRGNRMANAHVNEA
jgi:hypothetical protein